MKREIVLDTETTGLDPRLGDRLVEIAAIEIMNLMPTGKTFHKYLDPERDMPEEAFRIHGLSREFLTGKPKFGEIAEEFMEFIGEAKLIIHNAEFDMKFINAELAKVALPNIEMARVIDTLALARRKHPGAPNSLDALCARYQIDNSRRAKHGALLDSELLAEVYLELMGGRQSTFTLTQQTVAVQQRALSDLIAERPVLLPPSLQEQEWDAHQMFIEKQGPKSVWKSYFPN